MSERKEKVVVSEREVYTPKTASKTSSKISDDNWEDFLNLPQESKITTPSSKAQYGSPPTETTPINNNRAKPINPPIHQNLAETKFFSEPNERIEVKETQKAPNVSGSSPKALTSSPRKSPTKVAKKVASKSASRKNVKKSSNSILSSSDPSLPSSHSQQTSPQTLEFPQLQNTSPKTRGEASYDILTLFSEKAVLSSNKAESKEGVASNQKDETPSLTELSLIGIRSKETVGTDHNQLEASNVSQKKEEESLKSFAEKEKTSEIEDTIILQANNTFLQETKETKPHTIVEAIPQETPPEKGMKASESKEELKPFDSTTTLQTNFETEQIQTQKVEVEFAKQNEETPSYLQSHPTQIQSNQIQLAPQAEYQLVQEIESTKQTDQFALATQKSSGEVPIEKIEDSKPKQEKKEEKEEKKEEKEKKQEKRENNEEKRESSFFFQTQNDNTSSQTKASDQPKQSKSIFSQILDIGGEDKSSKSASSSNVDYTSQIQRLKRQNETYKRTISHQEAQLRDLHEKLEKSKDTLQMQEKLIEEKESLFVEVSSKASNSSEENLKLQKQLKKANQDLFAKQELLNSLKLDLQKSLQQKETMESANIRKLQEVHSKLEEKERMLDLEKEKLVSADMKLKQIQLKLQEALQQREVSEAIKVKRIEEQEVQLQTLNKKLKESHSMVKRLRQETEEYKRKATLVLQNQEKTIEQLSNGSNANLNLNSSSSGENLVVPESPSKSSKSPEVRDYKFAFLELQEKNEKTEKENKKKIDHLNELTEQLKEDLFSLQNEKSVLESNFNQLKSTCQELRKKAESSQIEISEKDQSLAEQSRKIGKLEEDSMRRLEEIERLKLQIKAKSIINSSTELESRLRSLGDHLIQKQNQVDSLIAEKNELKYQLEKMKRKNEELLKQPTEDTIVITVPDSNDETDTKSNSDIRLISLSSLCPVLTSNQNNKITKYVLTATNFVDNITKKIAFGLRNSPVFRILLILYIIVLTYLYINSLHLSISEPKVGNK